MANWHRLYAWSTQFCLTSMMLIIQLVLRVLPAYMYNSSTTLHAVVSSEKSCQECVQFNHFLQNASQYFVSESTVEFYPGNYTVDRTTYVVVRDAINLSWIGNAGNHGQLPYPVVSVYCDSKASFTFINITNLYISGIKFIQCGLTIPEDTANEAVTIQSHSFYRIPNGTKAAFMFVNVYDLILEGVNITESPGYGLLAINLLGNSKICNSFFHLNGPNARTWYSDLYAARDNCTKTHGTFVKACKGGNVLVIMQNTHGFECPKANKKYSFSVTGSVFSSGVALESLIEFPYYHIIPGSSGLGIISGQTSYALDIFIMNATFIGNHAYSNANMLVLVYDRVSAKVQITYSNFSNAMINWRMHRNHNSLSDSYSDHHGGVTFISGHKMPSQFVLLCRRYDHKLIKSFLIIQHCTFTNNSAKRGAALQIEIKHTNVYIDHCIFQLNKGESSLYIGLTDKHSGSHYTDFGNIRLSNIKVVGNYVFGHFMVGAITIQLHEGSSRLIRVIEITNCTFVKNRATKEATALNVIHLNKKGSYTIFVKDSHFHHNEQETIKKQSGILLLRHIKNIIVSGCTFAYNQGSAIVSITSTIYFSGDTYFIGNQGMYGGALSLHSDYNDVENVNASTFASPTFSSLIAISPTLLFFYPNTHLYLESNSATQRGGAIFVEDPPIRFDSAIDYPCFYQVIQRSDNQGLTDLNIRIRLENNTALVAGNSVYGGMQSSCVFSPSSLPDVFSAFDSLFTIAGPWSQSELASNPNAICVCRNETIYIRGTSCVNPIRRSVFPGQTFKVFAAVIGYPYVNYHSEYSAVPALIRVQVASKYVAKLGVRQNAQQLDNKCSELIFNLNTREPYVEIFLTVELPTEVEYLVTGFYQRHDTVSVLVNLTSCPLGFQLKDDDSSCDCAKQLHSASCVCYIDEQTVQCPVGVWVGNHSNKVIVHNHCPFDFCTTKVISINLDTPDKQCAFRRSGILCGECQQHLSLALGTSQCMECSNIFLLLIIPFMLVGILLALLLQLCNLTVSVGTINGLTYFANIIRINHAIFFPKGTNLVLSVFIAWLNLDLGVQTCFYAQMDMYAKTWLQIVFPVYIWILVGAIIKVSRYSILMSKLVGSNAVPVLATLFLLSYAKLLRTIITVLSFTHLTYPDGTLSAVWLYDGNVPFLKGKHAALFVMALVFMLGFIIPYTLLLLLSPCLQARSTHRGLRWVNKLKPILDAYHGPYKDRFRNWTGVMLVVRAVQFIIFAFNVQGNSSINLLVITICSCIHLVTWNLGSVYKNWLINILESYFILTLGIFAGASLYARTSDEMADEQITITGSIVGISFAVSIFIVATHTLKLIKPHCIKKLNWRNLIRVPRRVKHDNKTNEDDSSYQIHQHTVSYFELREPLNLMENNS